jgi:hypothetical protein
LEYFLKGKQWQEADEKTLDIMLFIANRENERYLDYPQIENFSCPALKQMDDYWVQNSKGNFGFSVQKKIWVDTGNRLGIKLENWDDNDIKNYLRFASAVGWYNERQESEPSGGYVGYEELIERIKKDPTSTEVRGGIPGSGEVQVADWSGAGDGFWLNRFPSQSAWWLLFSRTATCKV